MLALSACFTEAPILEEEIVVSGRAADPSFTVQAGSYATDSLEIAMTSADDATILYTLDGTSPVDLTEFSEKVAAFWDAFAEDTACREIYFDMQDTILDDVAGEHRDSWRFEIGGLIGAGLLEQSTLDSCIVTLETFTDPQYESLDYLLTAVDPQGIDDCVTVFNLMNETIVSDLNKWVDEVEGRTDDALEQCLVVFEGWDETVKADVDAMMYTGPITITQDTMVRAVAYRSDLLPSNVVSAQYTLTGAPNTPPQVSLSSPQAGEYVVGANLSVVASAQDADGEVVLVEFFVDGELFAQRSSAPWSTTWVAQSEGSYSFTARATDDAGARTTSSAVVVSVVEPTPENVPPTVAVVEPADGSVVALGELFVLRAEASDSDGVVERVEFLRDGSVFGQSTSAPYSVNVTGLSSGSYAFSARATDDDGASTLSSSVQVRVNAPPNVTISRPADGSVFEVGSTVYAEARAADDRGVDRVEFMLGSDVHVDRSAPYTAQYTLGEGSYTLSAVAYDTDGAPSAPASVSFSVVSVPTEPEPEPEPVDPPQVSISEPADGASFTRFSDATVRVDATNAARVELYAVYTHFASRKDTMIVVGSLTQSPYVFEIPRLREGEYRIIARATNADGVSVSDEVSLNVVR